MTYANGSIVSGSLSFGLGALPNTVDAAFFLTAGTPVPGTNTVQFLTGNVVSADISFGDATWSVNELINFSAITNGMFTDLTYAFSPINTPTVTQGPILNFPLTVTGTDIASGQGFQYRWQNSAQTLTAIPEPTTLTLFLIGLAGLGFVTRRRRRARMSGRP